MKNRIILTACVCLTSVLSLRAQVTTIDGIYVERDTSSFPVSRKVIIQDHDVIVFDIPGLSALFIEQKLGLVDVKLLFSGIALPELTPYVENLESGIVRAVTGPSLRKLSTRW